MADDIIQLLPDSVANQIAAGEVIQRPASVIKELVENSIDAGARNIKINIKDAGRTLIQVIDDGKGMSETDARMSFERHATSKIRTVEDIFGIRTMGFRGEALASIASVAQVDLRTRRPNDELGTEITINGSEFVRQESVNCPVGTNFCVKNLFFNVPARRKFLKTNTVELKNILDEIHRVALANSDIAFSVVHNDKDVYNLPASNLKQRIVNIFGKQWEKNLLSINSKTNIVNISGFIGKPEFAKKKNFEQFFFVNNRFMKHRVFYGSVMRAYEQIIPQGEFPAYFIFFDISPDAIDINIHPTKTEIKFVDESAIAQLLEATIRESLGKFNIIPSIDFSDDADYSDMFAKPTKLNMPSININPNYNPFNPQAESKGNVDVFSTNRPVNPLKHDNDWYSISENDFENSSEDFASPQLNNSTSELQPTIIESKINSQMAMSLNNENSLFDDNDGKYFQIKLRYIATIVKSGLMLIDQKRAHERILFEKYREQLKQQQPTTQLTLFPISFEAHTYEATLMREMLQNFRELGFDIEEFGQNTFVINGLPPEIKSDNVESVLHEMLQYYQDNDTEMSKDRQEKIAIALSKAASIKYGQKLSQLEMKDLIDRLFTCQSPNLSAEGKRTTIIIDHEELAKRFNS